MRSSHESQTFAMSVLEHSFSPTQYLGTDSQVTLVIALTKFSVSYASNSRKIGSVSISDMMTLYNYNNNNKGSDFFFEHH